MLEALADPAKADTVDPTTYKFRLYINMETGDERYDFVNTAMWIGSGVRQGAKGKRLGFIVTFSSTADFVAISHI